MTSTLHTGSTVQDIDGVERGVWAHAPRQTTRLYDLGAFTFYTSTGDIFAVRRVVESDHR